MIWEDIKKDIWGSAKSSRFSLGLFRLLFTDWIFKNPYYVRWSKDSAVFFLRENQKRNLYLKSLAYCLKMGVCIITRSMLSQPATVFSGFLKLKLKSKVIKSIMCQISKSFKLIPNKMAFNKEIRWPFENCQNTALTWHLTFTSINIEVWCLTSLKRAVRIEWSVS